MANVFLDANYLLDAIHRKTTSLPPTSQHTLYISPLSTHILCYSYKIRVPDTWLNNSLNELKIVDFTQTILTKALSGPTSDLEDNIQLHSAASTECEVFLTSDKKLASIAYFGRTKITTRLT